MKLTVLLNLLTFRQEKRTIMFTVDWHYMNTPKRWFHAYYQSYYIQKAAVKEDNLNITKLHA